MKSFKRNIYNDVEGSILFGKTHRSLDYLYSQNIRYDTERKGLVREGYEVVSPSYSLRMHKDFLMCVLAPKNFRLHYGYEIRMHRILNIFLKILFIYIQREGKRERKKERNTSVWLPLTCTLLGTWPKTQACALTGNRTGDPLVHRLALNLLSHTSQGRILNIFYNK